MISESHLRELAETSARLGRNPLLVQGAGGNSSIKDKDELWVKASGTWLSEAETREIFVPLSLPGVVETLGRGENVSAHHALEGRGGAGLRPSIETALHALMPHRVVLHAHAVNAMAVSVLAEGETIARARLGEAVRWRWIPYCMPGRALADAVREGLHGDAADVLLLQNHGVVVGADTPAAAEALLLDVEERLTMAARPWPDACTPAADGMEDELFEWHPVAARAALDPDAAALLTWRALIPDQVVFLGGAVPQLPEGARPSAHAAQMQALLGVAPALLISPGVGAFASRQRTAGTEQVIQGLLEIARRIPAGAAVSGLADADVAMLLDWDAEHYRLALDQARGAY